MTLVTDLEKAWLAGLLEGEGSFFLTGGRPRVKLEMTDADVVVRAAALFPLGRTKVCSYDRSLRPGRERMQTSYTYNWNGANAVTVMQNVLPYMGARRTAKINEILEADRQKKAGTQ